MLDSVSRIDRVIVLTQAKYSALAFIVSVFLHCQTLHAQSFLDSLGCKTTQTKCDPLECDSLPGCDSIPCGMMSDVLDTGCCSDWQIEFSAYGWMPWSSGTQTVVNRDVGVDANPVEMMVHLDRVPFMGYVEAKKGRLAFYTDFSFAGVDLSGSAVFARRSQSLSTVLGLDIAPLMIEGGILYEVAKWNKGCTSTTLEVLGGVRYWCYDATIKLDLEQQLDLRGLRVTEKYALAEETGVDWFDPLVGARIQRDCGDGKKWRLRGDIGGFGAGCKLTWNIATTYNFPVSCCCCPMTGFLGYRLLDLDYSQGTGIRRFESNMLVHGPIMGMVKTF